MAGEYAWICGIGMVTPVGGQTEQTAASVRAGISVYADSHVCNKRFEPITMALVPEDILPPLSEKMAGVTNMTSRQSRMLRLAPRPRRRPQRAPLHESDYRLSSGRAYLYGLPQAVPSVAQPDATS